MEFQKISKNRMQKSSFSSILVSMASHPKKNTFKHDRSIESILGDPKKNGTELIKASLDLIPEKPGVYKFYNVEETLLYVGKAKKLKSRLGNYTRLIGQSNRHIRMITAIHRIDYIRTATETEALLLEANLIKHLKPYYNILLRDDKSFPYLLIKEEHSAPQLVKHRGARKARGEYFGPFASTQAVNRTLEILQKTFQLRTCSDSVYNHRTRPCLLYQIKRCSAPCVNLVSIEKYKESILQAKDFLCGRSQQLRKDFQEKMKKAAEIQDYETALVFRERLKALATISAYQGIHTKTIKDADFFAVASQEGIIAIQVVFYRSGHHYGGTSYFPKHSPEAGTTEVLNAFLSQFYDNRPAPRLLLLTEAISEQALLSKALSEKNGHKVEILIPARGEKHALLQQVLTNAKEALHRKLLKQTNIKKQLSLLAKEFNLKTPPERIEVYDNSHIQGAHAVGAFIVFGKNGFEKNQYRTFTIKTANIRAGDDYAMMREVFRRRFSRLLSTDSSASLWPDLILIDGGKGHLSCVEKTLSSLKISSDTLALVAIAKGLDRNAGRETYFRPQKAPVQLGHNQVLAHFLQRLRDEAHRFAIGTHRAKRKRQIRANPLDGIEGIGQKRKKSLLQYFGSAKQVSEASLADFEGVEGISKSLAQKIYDYFQEN